MTQTVEITQNTALVLEGPLYCYEGDQPVFAVRKLGVSNIDSDGTLTMKVYKGSTDVTSTYTTGSMAASGNVVSTKTFQGLVGGDNLFVTLQGTCDGVLLTFGAFELRVKRRSGK